MKIQEKVLEIAKKNGYTTTKYQYSIIREIMAQNSVDVSEEDCKTICSLQRACREVLNSDEVALELAAQWKSESVARYEQEAMKTVNSLFKFDNQHPLA